MYPSETEERRFVLRLFDYWQVTRGERDLPSLADVNFNDIGKDAASCVVLDVSAGVEAAVLARVGLRLKPDGWAEAKGRPAADCPEDGLLFELLRHLRETIARRVPLSKGGAFTLRGRPALGRSILLPLSGDGKRVTHVFGGINFKFVDHEVAEPARLQLGSVR